MHWVGWMDNMEEYNVPPETKFSDIIVPTIDTIRSSHLIEMLLVNKKTVSWPCVRMLCHSFCWHILCQFMI